MKEKRKDDLPCDSLYEDHSQVHQVINRISVSADVDRIGEEMRELILEDIHSRMKKASVKKIWMKSVSIAASIILLLGVTNFLSYQHGFQEKNRDLVVLESPLGAKSSFVLSDGTKVILNSGTILKYPAVFHSKSREIEIKGEAFFDVAKEEKRPFIVSSENLRVNVLGTKFNVKSYDQDEQIEVTLEEGSVGIQLEKQSEMINIKPGEQLVYNKMTHNVLTHSIDPNHFISWKDGKYHFYKVSLNSIIKQLERNFNVHIEIASEKLGETLFTGDFIRGENLEQILRVMTIDNRLYYELEGNQVFIREKIK